MVRFFCFYCNRITQFGLERGELLLHLDPTSFGLFWSQCECDFHDFISKELTWKVQMRKNDNGLIYVARKLRCKFRYFHFVMTYDEEN